MKKDPLLFKLNTKAKLILYYSLLQKQFVLDHDNGQEYIKVWEGKVNTKRLPIVTIITFRYLTSF